MTNNPVHSTDTAKPDAVVTPAQVTPPATQKPDADKIAVTK